DNTRRSAQRQRTGFAATERGGHCAARCNARRRLGGPFAEDSSGERGGGSTTGTAGVGCNSRAIAVDQRPRSRRPTRRHRSARRRRSEPSFLAELAASPGKGGSRKKGPRFHPRNYG